MPTRWSFAGQISQTAVRALLALVLLVSLDGAASADQTDSRLPDLFVRLKTAETSGQALRTESRIWRLWLQGQTEEETRLMAEGVAAMQAGDLVQALDRFDVLVSIAPNFAEAWNKRATVHFFLGNYAKSVADIEQTLALESRHFGALSGLGLNYLAINEKAQALKAFKRVFEIYPRSPGLKSQIEALQEEVRGNPT